MLIMLLPFLHTLLSKGEPGLAVLLYNSQWEMVPRPGEEPEAQRD